MANSLIRRMTADDAAAVFSLESEAFVLPWSFKDFLYEMTENKVARYLVAEAEGGIIAFAGAHILWEQAHVTNIAVKKAFRGQGLGRRITLALLQYAANLGAEYMTLEVRQSNAVAQRLYTSLGFVKVNVRKRYYSDTGEDAWLMVCDNLPPAENDFTEQETVAE